MSPRALATRWAVARLGRQGRSGRGLPPPGAAVAAMGLVFASPVGLAAGFDRHGALLPVARRLGLGAVEMGSLAVTAAAIRPRRLLPPGAAVCRGLSLVMPPDLAWEPAASWFARALARHHRAADYLVVNPGRGPVAAGSFAALVASLARLRDRLPRPRRLPLVAKLPAAWLTGEGGGEVAQRLAAAGADGLLVSAEGAPERACLELAKLAAAVGPRVCLISVGGIRCAAEARARLAAGASLVQIHRCLLGRGPRPLAMLEKLAWPGRQRRLGRRIV